MNVPGFIQNHSTIKDERMWHFYVTLASWASIYTAMNVSVVLFLNEALGSIFMAGLALAIGSLFSMLFDGLFSSLQRLFPPRNLFLTSIVGMIIAVLLFIISTDGMVMAFVAAIFFRISFDLCDITAVSYVLGRSQKSQYGQNLSYKQLAQGIGMLIGLAVSAVLLATGYFIGETVESAAELVNADSAILDRFLGALMMMKVFLLTLLCALWIFAFMLFDRDIHKITKQEIYHHLRIIRGEAVQKIKHMPSIVLMHIPFLNRSPKTEKKNDNSTPRLSKKEIFEELTGSALTFFSIFQKKPRDIGLIWSMGVMGLFSYWDTFLATFLPIFFTEVLREQSGWLQNIPGSLMMLLFILPVLGLLPVVAKMGDTFGRHYFMILGLIVTAVSTLVLGLVSVQSFFILIVAGFGVAFGYLFGMSSAKAQTASKLNTFLSRESSETQEESNSSAGPIMVVDNIGNIIGPLLGGFFIDSMGFQGFFVFFALFLFALIAVTGKNYKKVAA